MTAANEDVRRARDAVKRGRNATGAKTHVNGHDGDLDERSVVFDEQATRPTARFFRFEPLAEFKKGATLEWFVKRVLPRAGLGAIYGQPGCGKSFFALDLVMVIARGLPMWRGQRRSKGGRVAYVVAEGATGRMTPRGRAFCPAPGLPCAECTIAP